MEFAGFGRNKEGESGTLRKGITKKLPLKYFKLDEEHADRKGSQQNDFRNDQDLVNQIYYYKIKDMNAAEEEKMNERYSSFICTGAEEPFEKASAAAHGDSGCGLFEAGSKIVLGVAATGYLKAEHPNVYIFSSPTTWVRVSSKNVLDWISGIV